LSQSEQLGSIQNVGVVPEHRGRGLGRALVLKSLEGFALARLKRIVLEVTATNRPAVELYRSVGFHVVKTMYRSAPLEELAY
jgi:ribosomal protein S18 acetylase RimI-like enzyme